MAKWLALCINIEKARVLLILVCEIYKIRVSTNFKNTYMPLSRLSYD